MASYLEGVESVDELLGVAEQVAGVLSAVPDGRGDTAQLVLGAVQPARRLLQLALHAAPGRQRLLQRLQALPHHHRHPATQPEQIS